MRVFISYSRGDSEVADRMVEALEALEHTVTIDRRSLPYGEEWQEQLAGLIRACDTVVWLVSARSTDSKWCLWELGEAQREAKRLIPVRIEAVGVSELPETLGKLHFLPAVGCYDPDQHLNDLHDALLADHAWIAEHTRLADRAIEWISAARPEDKLIRGVSLSSAEAWVARKSRSAPPVHNAIFEFILASRRAEQRRERQSQEQAIRIAQQRAQLLCSISDQQSDPIVASLVALEAWAGGGGEFEGFAALDRFLDAGGDDATSVPIPPPEDLVDLPDYSGPASRLTRHLSNCREERAFGDWEQGKIWDVALDARRIAVLGDNGEGKVWNLDTGEAIAVLRVELDRAAPAEKIDSLALSADGVFAVAGTSKGRFLFWDVHCDKVYPGFTLKGRSAGPVVFNPENWQVVCGSSRGDLFILDLNHIGDDPDWFKKDGASIGLTTFDGAVGKLRFSANRRYFVASGGQNEQLRVLDLETGRLVMKIEPGGHVGSLELSEDGSRIAATVRSRLVVWTVPNGEKIYDSEVWKWALRVRITADGNQLLIPTRSGEIEVQPVDGGQAIVLGGGGGGRVHDLIHVAERGITIASFDSGAVRVWSDDGRMPELELHIQSRFSCDGLLWDAARKRLIGLSYWGQARVWNIDRDRVAPRRSELGSIAVDRLQFSPRGDYVVGASDHVPGISIWSVRDGRLVHERTDVKLEQVFSPDHTGSRVVGTCKDKVVVVSLDDGSLGYPPAFRNVIARSVLTTTDGMSAIANSSRRGIGFAGLGIGSNFVAFKGEIRGTVRSAETSRELPLLVTLSSEGDVDLWDVTDGHRLGHLELASPTVNPIAAGFHETDCAVTVGFTDGTGLDVPLSRVNRRWLMHPAEKWSRNRIGDDNIPLVFIIPDATVQLADYNARKLIYEAPRDGPITSPVAHSPQAGCTAEWVAEEGRGGRVWFRDLPPLVARVGAPRMWKHVVEARGAGLTIRPEERRFWWAERQRWLYREASKMLTRRLGPLERQLLGLGPEEEASAEQSPPDSEHPAKSP